MKYIKSLEESYLLSNRAPLYHLTDIMSLYDILSDNKLKRTEFDNIFKDKVINMVSLTRNSDLNLSYYKEFLDVVIELDRDMLNSKYKIIPYDFFINNKKEIHAKSSIMRKSPFEFEEIILKDIDNVISYIISLNFKDEGIYNPIFNQILKLIKNKNIKIKKDGTEIVI